MPKFNETKYKNEFAKKTYDRIELVVPKGMKIEIRAAADVEGRSVNAYILDALRKKMERD